MTVQDHAAKPCADVPETNRHIMLDGSRAVLGMDRDGRGTVLIPWTGCGR